MKISLTLQSHLFYKAQQLSLNQHSPSTSLYGLDVLRGIAIILVFYFHASLIIFGQDFSFDYQGLLPDLNAYGKGEILIKFLPFSYGWSGVELFLVISGFLIHHSFLNSGHERLDLKLFLNKRFWRIYPPYLLALVFFMSIHGVMEFTNGSFQLDILYHLIFFHNYDTYYFFSFNPSFWSLALEFQLYLCYPFLLYGIRCMGKWNVMGILTIVYGLSTYWVWHHGYSMGKGYVEFYSLPRFMIIWYLGAFLAELYQGNPNQKPIPLSWVWGGVAFFILSKFLSPFQENQVLMAAVISMMVIQRFLAIPWNQPSLSNQLLADIGKCSFSIYLIHQPFLRSMMNAVSFLGLSRDYGQWWGFVDATLVFMVIYLISKTTYSLIEVPSINYGRKFFKLYLSK